MRKLSFSITTSFGIQASFCYPSAEGGESRKGIRWEHASEVLGCKSDIDGRALALGSEGEDNGALQLHS